jgi:hypothetical protein
MVTTTGSNPKALSGKKCKPTRGAKKCVHTTAKGKFVGKSKGGKGSGHGGK